MKKYLLFDLDGTLTDPMVGITTCVQYALKAFDIEEPDLEKLTPFIGPPLRESFQKFYGFTPEQAEEATAKYRERFQDVGLFENEVYEGIPQMLRTLQSKGVFLAVASSKPQIYVERILEHFDLRKYFKVVVGSELDGTRDRKEEVVQEALNRLFAYKPIQRDQVYMIGDRCFDIAGAKAQGIESVGVAYGYGDIEELKEAKADYIVRSVEELQKFLLRGVEELQPQMQAGVNKFSFAAIWPMLFAFLIFILVNNVVMYAFELLCVQLWSANLPGWLDSFLFIRDPEILGEAEFAFTGNQGAIKYALGFIGGMYALRKEAKEWIDKAAEDTKLNHLRKDGAMRYVLLAGATIGAVLGLNLLMELLGLISKSAGYQQVQADQYSAHFFVGLVTYCLVSPMAEEVLFRGVLHNYLRTIFKPKNAVFFSAAFFGIYHMNYIQGIYGFLMGCLIAYAYEYFGTFRVPVAVHMGANVLAYCLTYTSLVTTGFVSWPVCIVFSALAIVCLVALDKQKTVF